MNFSNSHCRGSYVHKFVSLSFTHDAVLERCLKCGTKHVIKLVNGLPNIVEYSRYHMREFLIPQHRLFKHEYGSR